MSRPTPLAKPSGITLRDHRQHVYDEALRLLDARPLWSQKYNARAGDDLRMQTRRAAWWHDIGKDDRVGWQAACRKDYERYQQWREAEGLDPDVVNSADYARYERYCRVNRKNTGENLLAFAKRTGFRHEFESLLTMHEQRDISFSLAERVAVAAHHGHLSRKARDIARWEEKCNGRFANLWKSLMLADRFQRRDLDAWQAVLLERYRLAGPRAILQLADTRASRAEAGGWVPPIEKENTFPYTFPYTEKRGVQRDIEQVWDDPIGLLRAPTGSGKTDAALLWIKHQVERGRADRGVILMPTRFTSNALEKNIRDYVGATGLYHSSAWCNRFGDTTGQAKSNARERHKLARLLMSDVTVCTLDHLLIGLTGTKEDHHAIFFNMAHAAIVIDEIDFYDPFVQANLTLLLEVLRTLQVPVLLMSATLPESSRTLYGVTSDIVNAPEEPRRYRRTLAWVGDVSLERDEAGRIQIAPAIADVLRTMISTGTGIIYANTVRHAWRYRQWLIQEGVHNDRIILYHSRFTEPDKKTIETERLLARLGKEAWESDTASGIAIMTQIGEMSVNVSAPIMFSEACPWDRLAQRAGRNGRFDTEGHSILYIAQPIRRGTVYPAPYGTPPMGGATGWVAAPAYEQSVAQMKDVLDTPTEVNAAFYVERVDELYPTVPDFSGGAQANRERLEELIPQTWMIVPPQDTNEDEGTLAGQWRSRDIMPQQTVFVCVPEEVEAFGSGANDAEFRFENWGAYQAFVLEYGVSVPTYLIEKELRRGPHGRMFERNVSIGYDGSTFMTLFFVTHYDSDIGLAWLDADEDERDLESSTFII